MCVGKRQLLIRVNIKTETLSGQIQIKGLQEKERTQFWERTVAYAKAQRNKGIPYFMGCLYEIH